MMTAVHERTPRFSYGYRTPVPVDS
jgi:hypothetical protein